MWIESQNVTADEYGRFSVLLGATTSGGVPVELFSSGESRWLGVQAQLPGEVEQPRVLLVSVPYALKAADAETVGGLPARPLCWPIIPPRAAKERWTQAASSDGSSDGSGTPTASSSTRRR